MQFAKASGREPIFEPVVWLGVCADPQAATVIMQLIAARLREIVRVLCRSTGGLYACAHNSAVTSLCSGQGVRVRPTLIHAGENRREWEERDAYDRACCGDRRGSGGDDAGG